MHRIGKVSLVGAGPGDPGLLTLRGLEVLQSAEVVLYDRLCGEEILALLPAGAERIDVGKNAGNHLIPQEEINELLLRHAREGRHAVRLKGGDPYLFGRGAEELAAIARAGIPFEVVPGVTSALAVPSWAGIPLTHRDMASSVHIIAGHPRHGAAPDIRYRQLVGLGGTLVFLMGVGALPELTRGLLAADMPEEMPAALVENGTRPDGRRLLSTVGEIAGRAAAEGFRPPSVLVVGEVCTLAESLDWRARLPLAGVQVVVTRPRAVAGSLCGRLRALGCIVTEFPCIRTAALPLPADLQLPAGGWAVFTSPAGVEHFFASLLAAGGDARAFCGMRIAAVGAKTAQALLGCGLRADYVPAEYSGAALAAGLLAEAAPGDAFVLLRAKDGAPALAGALRDGGHAVTDVAVYRTIYDSPEADRVLPLLRGGERRYVTFTSASTVHSFARALAGSDFSGITGICIGEETAAAARGYGIAVRVSDEATLDSLIDCIRKEAGA